MLSDCRAFIFGVTWFASLKLMSAPASMSVLQTLALDAFTAKKRAVLPFESGKSTIAPAASRAFAQASRSLSAARIKAVIPVISGAFTSAPAPSNMVTASGHGEALSVAEAPMRAVPPVIELRPLTFAPACSSCSTTAVRSKREARISAVSPSSSVASNCGLCCSISETRSANPKREACSRGVLPYSMARLPYAHRKRALPQRACRLDCCRQWPIRQ